MVALLSGSAVLQLREVDGLVVVRDGCGMYMRDPEWDIRQLLGLLRCNTTRQ